MSVAVRCRCIGGVGGKYVSRLRFMLVCGVKGLGKTGRTVLLTDDVADRLKGLKVVRRESYSDVIMRLLECLEELSGEKDEEALRKWLYVKDGWKAV